MADEPKPEAEAPPESSEEQAPAPDAAPAEAPAGEAPPAKEAKPEAGGEAEAESEAETTTATEQGGTAEESASAEAEAEAPPEGTAVKAKSSRTLAEQKKSVERLSVKKHTSGDTKKKSKSIIFEEAEKPEEAAEPAAVEVEEGEPAPAEVKEKRPKRKTKVQKSQMKGRQTAPGKKRVTVFKSKGDFEGKPRYQNTYRLESYNPFSPDRVFTIIKTTMDAALKDARYNADECTKLVASLSEEIRNKIKLQCYDRYKIAVQVFIGERKEQSVYSIMRPLWDTERDHYSIYALENTTLFAIAFAVGVYFE